MQIFALAVVSAVIAACSAEYKVVCYWGSWSHYRWGNGKFTVDEINPNLCTHAIYGFVGMVPDGNIRILDENLDYFLKNFERFNALKQINPNLKTLLAIGGWNEGSANYSIVAADASRRSIFINSALNLVQTWGFDGFDLDWEYPAQRGGEPEDVENFVTLIREFREEFDKHNLLLTAAVAASPASVDRSYDVPALSKYLDFINVMSYDLHGSWSPVTGHHSGLYPSSIDVNETQRTLNVDACIRGWIERGADPQKVIIGIPTYGRTFTLADPRNNSLGANVVGGGDKGLYSSENGFFGYNEIVEVQNKGGWTVVWDDNQKVPYTFKGNQWIGYDNPKSTAIKVKYAKELKLGGVMLYALETDDFLGLSGTKNAILTTINKCLVDDDYEPIEPEPTPNPTPEPTVEPQPNTTNGTPSPEPVNDVCTKDGIVRDPNDCSVFYFCQKINDGFHVTPGKCQFGLVFDTETNSCNYPENVQC